MKDKLIQRLANLFASNIRKMPPEVLAKIKHDLKYFNVHTGKWVSKQKGE